MRNKIFIISFSLVLVILLCSCGSQPLAPWDIPGSFWNDSANGISFSIPESKEDPITGTYTSDDEIIELTVKHDNNSIAFFESSDEELNWDNALIHGSCKYDELLLTVVVESSSIDQVSEGSVIVFFKGDSTSTTD